MQVVLPCGVWRWDLKQLGVFWGDEILRVRGYANFGSRQKSIFEHKGIQFLKRQHKKGFWKQLRQLFFGGAVLFFFQGGRRKWQVRHAKVGDSPKILELLTLGDFFLVTKKGSEK